MPLRRNLHKSFLIGVFMLKYTPAYRTPNSYNFHFRNAEKGDFPPLNNNIERNSQKCIFSEKSILDKCVKDVKIKKTAKVNE